CYDKSHPPHLRQKKTPTTRGWGQATCRHWHPFPRKAPQSKTKQVSWLAAHPYSLPLPKVLTPQWLWQISFRSQLRGSDGFRPSSLLTASCCEATWLSSTSQLSLYPSVISGLLSRTIVECAYAQSDSRKHNDASRAPRAAAP